MAVLKDLIVHGASRFLGDTYFNFLKANDIAADTGYFKKLTAVEGTIDDLTSTNLTTKNATVTALLDVQGEMHTNSWSNANIATIDGSFYINPTSASGDGSDVSAANYTPTGTITYNNNNYTKLEITGTFNTSQLSLDTASNVAWPANSYVIVTGDVLVENEWYPLGTIRGKLQSQLAANSNSKTITVVPIGATIISGEVGASSLTDGHGLKPQTLEAIRLAAPTAVAASPTTLKMRKIKVSMTSYGGTYQSPIGIYMTAMGGNKKTFLDIYGGKNNTTTIPSGSGALAEPTVRIGNLEGMPATSGVTPHGWGIYTNNGFFTGTIVAQQGKIGNGSAAWTIGNDANSGVAYIYTGTQGSNSSAYLSTGYGTVSIADSGALSGTKWAFTAGANFGVTTNGTLYAKGAQISGNVAATQGFTVTSAATNGVTLASMTTSGITLGDTTTANNKFNILITDSAVSEKGPGILLRKGTNVLNEITADRMKLYLNDDSTNSIAEFGSTTQIGKHNNSQSYLLMDYHSLQMIDKEGNSYFYVSDLRGSDGTAQIILKYISDGQTYRYNLIPQANSYYYTVEVSDNSGGSITMNPGYVSFSSTPNADAIITITYTTNDSSAKAYTIGLRASNTQIGALSLAEGYSTEASGLVSHAEGRITKAKGNCSHAEGYSTEANGDKSHAEGYSTKANNEASHAEGVSTKANGYYSHAEGYNTEANGYISHAEGYSTKANNEASHTEGRDTIASGAVSHAEGRNTIADGYCSHAEGYSTEANEYYSHAEGYNAEANGETSHAEGHSTKASGRHSHAEGSSTRALGLASHVQNYYTVAATDYQTVIGKYNIATRSGSGTEADPYIYTNTGNFAFVIGNGSGDNTNSRSNALTVDWDGNVNIASGAKYKINGVALSASDVSAVPTSRTINSKALSSDISLTASDVSAVPTSRTVNSKALSSDISLTAADVGAVPTTRTVNSKALSSNISLTASDVGALPNPSAGSVSEMGQYLDLHANGGASDYDVRLSTNAATSTGGGFLHINGQPIKDFVVARETKTTTGLATSWTVRKWNSGYCEAYAVTTLTGFPMTNQYGYAYYYSATASIPSGIFTSVDYAQVTRYQASNGSGLISASVYALSTTAINWYAFNTQSGTVNASFVIRVIGKWK